MVKGSWLRQPLLHFVLGALLIFGLSALSGSRDGSQIITVTTEDISRLASGWERRWGRPPTASELDDLIADRIEEEVYVRQAQALGLDQDDPFIRNYLRRKMEILTEGVITVPDPAEAELRAYHGAHQERFSSGPQFTFRQALILRPDEADIASLIEDLNGGADASRMPKLAGAREMRAAGQFEVSRDYGVTFFEALSDLDKGVWQGPVRSSVGVHVVYIEEARARTPLAFEAVRQDVAAAWGADKRAELQEQAFERLKRSYRVSIGPRPE